MSEEDRLESELKAGLAGWRTRFAIWTTPCFGDFLWDEMTFEEVQALDPAVFVDALVGPRRIVLQRVRGEVRYWLATERDPVKMSKRGKGELGVVDSVSRAVLLCDEFLSAEVQIEDLLTERKVGHRVT